MALEQFRQLRPTIGNVMLLIAGCAVVLAWPVLLAFAPLAVVGGLHWWGVINDKTVSRLVSVGVWVIVLGILVGLLIPPLTTNCVSRRSIARSATPTPPASGGSVPALQPQEIESNASETNSPCASPASASGR
jgi:hypothetical protein